MRKSYKFRIYPNKKAIRVLNTQLELCRNLYNCALEQRIIAYKEFGKTISYYDQAKELSEIREAFPEYKEVFSQTLQAVLKTLDNAYKGFFRRVKAKGTKAGFPRFKGKGRFNSLCFPQYPRGLKLEGRHLVSKNIGRIKVMLHQEIRGKIKTVTIKKTATNKWFAIFSCDEVPQRILPKTGDSCGIDMGISSFLTTSDGTKIPNPKFLKQSAEILEARQQRLSKAKKGTQKRNKLRILVSKAYEKIVEQRRDFQFKLANQLVRRYDVICCEDLKPKQMVEKEGSFRVVNRNIADCSWGSFLNILAFKAEEAGKQVVKVDPKNTSKMCSNCQAIVPKTLSERIHHCPSCGLSLDRDINAAKNILRLGTSRLGDSIRILSPKEANPF